MVCASVREDNPRTSASGLLPVQTHEPYSYFILKFEQKYNVAVGNGFYLTGLDWTGLDWIGLDWIGLDST